jgi:aminopeptidase-like protein
MESDIASIKPTALVVPLGCGDNKSAIAFFALGLDALKYLRPDASLPITNLTRSWDFGCSRF